MCRSNLCLQKFDMLKKFGAVSVALRFWLPFSGFVRRKADHRTGFGCCSVFAIRCVCVVPPNAGVPARACCFHVSLIRRTNKCKFDPRQCPGSPIWTQHHENGQGEGKDTTHCRIHRQGKQQLQVNLMPL